MTNTELLQEGINLMVIGIGFVMLFLLILVYAIGGISTLINRFFPENCTKSPPSVSPTHTHTTDDGTDLRPVIVAAIAHHRRQQQTH